MRTEEGNKTSLFNEGLFKVQRINNHLVLCNNYSRKGELTGWRSELDVIWRELSSAALEVDDENPKKNFYFKEKKRIDDLIHLAFKIGVRSLMYEALSKKEEYLRALQDRTGLGTKFINSDMEGMDD